jgi:general secretion pathway protein I
MTRPQRGFTLLEMLAALAVLALCATVSLGAFGQSARALQQSARSDHLNQAARSLMDELDSAPLVQGHRQGHWDDVQWTLDVAPEPSVAGAAQLLRVDLRLTTDGRELRLSTQRVQAGSTTL